jgi:hypothetical protein
MIDRAPYHENLPGQLDMWKDYSTPACNSVRAKNSPPEPDADGLFDLAGVREICGRRQCTLSAAGEFCVTVTHKTATTQLHAIAPGRWDPVSILKARATAHGRQTFEVDEDTAKPTNPEGLDEIKIARIVGADGLRPYLSRTGRHALWEDMSFASPGDTQFADRMGMAINRLNVTTRVVLPEKSPRSGVGHATWAFRTILYVTENLGNYEVRRALRALEDVGLVTIEPGPRGGMATAKLTWTERAYLPKPTPRPVALAADDEHALDCLAAGVR